MSPAMCPPCLRSVQGTPALRRGRANSRYVVALRRKQFPRPGVFGFADPVAATDVAESFCQRVVDDGVAIAAIAEIGAAERVDAAIAVAHEDAVRVEDLYAEVALELAEEPEHAIDRAAGR